MILGIRICIMPCAACMHVTWPCSYKCSASLSVELRYEDVDYAPPSSWLIKFKWLARKQHYSYNLDEHFWHVYTYVRTYLV